jgi:GLPGLI family protein
MKLYTFISFVLLPLCVFAQGDNNLVFHFQTKANYVVSDYDLIVGEEVSVWQETVDPGTAADAPADMNYVPTEAYEREILFKQRDKNVCISRYEPWKGLFYLKDTLSNLPWRIEAKPKRVSILGYKCEEASMTFRGREYQVWFTPQIPLAEGPWKLSGLPGMILKVEIKGGGETFKMECYGIDRHEIDTEAILENFLRKAKVREFLSWPAFVSAFEVHVSRRSSEIQAEMAADGGGGFSMVFKLENQLEIFSPDLQGDGIILEF